MTGTYYETGTFTWVICLILALVGYILFNFINDRQVLRDWNLHLGHLSYTGPCRVHTFLILSMTGMYYETGTFTWVICLILALVGYILFNFINDRHVLRDWNLHLGHLSYTGPCRVRTFLILSMTGMYYETGTFTWVICLILALVGYILFNFINDRHVLRDWNLHLGHLSYTGPCRVRTFLILSMTGMYYETGTFTWVICLILALVGYILFNFINDRHVLRDWNLHLGHLSYTGPCRVRTF